ncbi:MAG: alpha/beta hydrolase [Chloroflexi bacterium]|nr:alpha/beta hydrolase [Chloroflexota bacterium]
MGEDRGEMQGNGTAQLEAGFLDVENGRLYFEVSGSGTPLVLVHAGVANLRMWDDDVPALAKRHRVVRYDTRGFGQTTTEEATFSNRDDLRDLLDHLNIERTAVLGISRGGSIALDFTLEFPERVSSLIIVASGLGGFETENPTMDDLWRDMEQLWEAKSWERLTDMEVALWVDGPGQPPDRVPAAIRDRVRDMILTTYQTHEVEGQPRPLHPPAVGRLGEIAVPTQVIVGDLDEPGVLAASDAIASRVSAARKVVLPGVAHMVNLERPAEFQRLVLDFLATTNPHG